jgi:glycosyltransferase involved in cell wall biosynthesis
VNIVHVVASLDPAYGGPSVVAPALCAALARRGHDVTIATTDRGAGGRYVPDVLPADVTLTVARQHPPKSYGAAFGLLPRLARLYATADVVHVHSLYLFHTLAATRLARLRKVPYVIRPHGSLDDYHFARGRLKKGLYEWLIERSTLRHASVVHCASQRERAALLRHGFRANPEVIPHGIDRETVQRSHMWARTDEGLVLFLGRVTAKKNIDILIRAFALLPQPLRRELLIAGPDNEDLTTRLMDLVRRLGVHRQVRFAGPIYGDDKWRLIRRASVFVLPSQDESFGVAVLESMAAGTPVVVSPNVALAHEIQAAGAGWIVPAEPVALAAVLADILQDDQKRHSAGISGSRTVLTQYTWDRIAADMEQMYKGMARAGTNERSDRGSARPERGA